MNEEVPLRRVQAALACATERFAKELNSPDQFEPDWSAFEWTMARAAAVLHGVTPLLATRLRWRGPASWRQFASTQFQHVAARHTRIEALLDDLHQDSGERGIGFIALKGAALHELQIYQPGERPMADVDLLVRPDDAAGMIEVLRGLNYSQSAANWRHAVLMPDGPPLDPRLSALGEHRDAPIKIELHTAIIEQVPVTMRDISPLILRGPLAPGRNAYPSTLALMQHLLLHAAGNIVAHGLRLIQLHDIAMLGRRLTVAEWQDLTSIATAFWMLPPLQLAERYFPGSVPSVVLAILRQQCPHSLKKLGRSRRISELSYSRLRAQPFPGLEWSTSATEAMRCIWRRLRPDAVTRGVLAVTRKEAWTSGSTLHLSHPRRILQHLLRWPPRPAPMYVVRAAIAAAGGA